MCRRLLWTGLSAVISFSFARANPVVLTFLNEFSADPEHQWVELCARPLTIGDTWLTGWRITTSCSECTLDCLLPDGGMVVIDSQGLANHEVGSGTFRLNPEEDVITLHTPGWDEGVGYPRTPTDIGAAPCPPLHGSSSFWNHCPYMEQCFNWYMDSTPTPGAENDDYSTIAGHVLVDYLPDNSQLYVYASGPYGNRCVGETCLTTSYTVPGLGAGPYQLSATMIWPHGSWNGERPDLVEVGYSQVLTGVVIDLRTIGVTEKGPKPQASSLKPHATVVRGVLWLEPASSIKHQATSRLLDAAGRKVLDLHPGANDVSRLAPGVYFVSERSATSGKRSAVAVRKVVVTR